MQKLHIYGIEKNALYRTFVDVGHYTCASLVDYTFFKNDDSHALQVFDPKSKEAMEQVAVIAQKL